MAEAQTTARLHQHAGRVALRIGEGKTQYLNWYLAEQLAEELKLAAEQVRHGNHYETTNINILD